MDMKNFLCTLRRILNGKYPGINFEFYLPGHIKNVQMGLNCSMLTLHDHDQIISGIENIWLKRQDMKFKFVMPQLYIQLTGSLNVLFLGKILTFNICLVNVNIF